MNACKVGSYNTCTVKTNGFPPTILGKGILNSNIRSNQTFIYPHIWVIIINIDGPVTNLLMKIDGMPSPLETDSSHIYLLTGTSREAGNIDYIEFIQFGKKMEDELLSKKGTNIFVDMNLTATPACNM